jgi:hypothetical protein
MSTFYEVKEGGPAGFRAVVVTPDGHGSGHVDFLSSDDATHTFALEDFAFLLRAARSLPRELLEQTVQIASTAQRNETASSAPSAPEERAEERPERAGKRWSEEEIEQALKRFSSGVDIATIAKEHQRTPSAIVSYLLKLGRIKVTVVR